MGENIGEYLAYLMTVFYPRYQYTYDHILDVPEEYREAENATSVRVQAKTASPNSVSSKSRDSQELRLALIMARSRVSPAVLCAFRAYNTASVSTPTDGPVILTSDVWKPLIGVMEKNNIEAQDFANQKIQKGIDQLIRHISGMGAVIGSVDTESMVVRKVGANEWEVRIEDLDPALVAFLKIRDQARTDKYHTNSNCLYILNALIFIGAGFRAPNAQFLSRRFDMDARSVELIFRDVAVTLVAMWQREKSLPEGEQNFSYLCRHLFDRPVGGIRCSDYLTYFGKEETLAFEEDDFDTLINKVSNIFYYGIRGLTDEDTSPTPIMQRIIPIIRDKYAIKDKEIEAKILYLQVTNNGWNPPRRGAFEQPSASRQRISGRATENHKR